MKNRDLVDIERCNITESMLKRHEEEKQLLENEPHLCVSHSIIVIDQSGKSIEYAFLYGKT